MHRVIVSRRQTDKHLLSLRRQLEADIVVVIHLGGLKREFASGELDGSMFQNMDENSLHMNMNNHTALGYQVLSHCKL